jgi:hypothetical protein
MSSRKHKRADLRLCKPAPRTGLSSESCRASLTLNLHADTLTDDGVDGTTAGSSRPAVAGAANCRSDSESARTPDGIYVLPGA